RFKLALTEETPTIKPYFEDRWAELADTKSTPIEVSLTLLESLHDRWVRLLRSLQPEDWKRSFRHPELGPVSLEKNLAIYAWHGRHHVAHVSELRKRMGW
ncbi:MAG TPA: DinB family protein, partial [Candidatus Aquilonibacter sp.]|nr:DinB family protein [Candidatus Aquilonibacter sp.]